MHRVFGVYITRLDGWKIAYPLLNRCEIALSPLDSRIRRPRLTARQNNRSEAFLRDAKLGHVDYSGPYFIAGSTELSPGCEKDVPRSFGNEIGNVLYHDHVRLEIDREITEQFEELVSAVPVTGHLDVRREALAGRSAGEDELPVSHTIVDLCRPRFPLFSVAKLQEVSGIGRVPDISRVGLVCPVIKVSCVDALQQPRGPEAR